MRKIEGLQDCIRELRYALERETELIDRIDRFEKRMEDVECKQGFMARRDPPKIPKFPKVLRLYGLVPPEERATA